MRRMVILALLATACSEPTAVPIPDPVIPDPVVPADPPATDSAGFLLVNSGSVIAIGCERGAVCVSAFIHPTGAVPERWAADFGCTCQWIWASITLIDAQGNEYWHYSFTDLGRLASPGRPTSGRIDMGYLPSGQFPANIISVPVLLARLR